MVIHHLTIVLQEAAVQSSSLDSRFRDILKKIDELVIRDENETKARIDFENKECFRAVQAWKAHLLRSVNQEEAKQNALTQIDEESSLIDYHRLGDEISAIALLEVLHLGYIYYEAKASEKALKKVIIVCTTRDKTRRLV